METLEPLFREIDSSDKQVSRRRPLKLIAFTVFIPPVGLGSDNREFLRRVARTPIPDEAVGARRVFLPLLRPPKIETMRDLKKIEKLDFGYDDLILYSDHTCAATLTVRTPAAVSRTSGGESSARRIPMLPIRASFRQRPG